MNSVKAWVEEVFQKFFPNSLDKLWAALLMLIIGILLVLLVISVAPMWRKWKAGWKAGWKKLRPKLVLALVISVILLIIEPLLAGFFQKFFHSDAYRLWAGLLMLIIAILFVLLVMTFLSQWRDAWKEWR
ncbi:MAG TPA: hypothetical protein VGL29_14200, partial [Blastocatellia bacterium]